MFNSSFPTLRTVCIWDLQCFHSFRNCCLFCKFWLIRNLYYGHEEHVNYSKHSLNDHYQHCEHCAYDTYSILEVFEMAVCFAHFGIFEIFTDSHHLWWTLFKSSFQTLRTVCVWDLQCFETFRNCCLFCTFWLIRNFYSGEAHDVNYRKHSLNDHLQHCAHCVYDIYSICKVRNGCLFCTYWLIRNLNCADSHHASYGERCSNNHFRHCAQCVSETYSVLKLFEIAVCFAHFGIFEISTAVRRIMPTIPNIV